VAHAGKGRRRDWAARERKGRPQGKRKREQAGLLGWAAALFSFLFFFSFFSTLKPFKQFYLISNKFEFKPYKLNTRKIMLQHECTNKLIL
jgi:hypothetical protein